MEFPRADFYLGENNLPFRLEQSDDVKNDL